MKALNLGRDLIIYTHNLGSFDYYLLPSIYSLAEKKNRTVFTYLVTAYRPIAASAMAANSFMRTSFAAAFPLFAPAMYHRLSTVGATALLAGLCAIMAPLP